MRIQFASKFLLTRSILDISEGEGRWVHEQDPTMQTSAVCKTRNKGLFLESPRSFLGLESYFVFAVFTFKIKASSILTMTQWNYQLTKAKLTGLLARNCATIKQVLILKLAFGPEKFPGFSRTRPGTLPEHYLRTPRHTQKHPQRTGFPPEHPDPLLQKIGKKLHNQQN